jgi:hypothetical protein
VARGGELLQRNIALINAWNAEGFAIRERNKFRYVVESVDVAESSAKSATVAVCTADGSVRVRPGAAPDGSDVVVNDDFISGRTEWQFRLQDDGVWRAIDTVALGPSERTDVCPPA